MVTLTIDGTEVIIADGGLMHADTVGRAFDIGAEHADIIEFALEQTDQFLNLWFDFHKIG